MLQLPQIIDFISVDKRTSKKKHTGPITPADHLDQRLYQRLALGAPQFSTHCQEKSVNDWLIKNKIEVQGIPRINHDILVGLIYFIMTVFMFTEGKFRHINA